MKYIVDGTEMKQIDAYTIQKTGIQSLVLMERAALETVKYIKKVTKKWEKILILCGTGNNGGDGIAVGRILYQKGYSVEIVCLGNLGRQTTETRVQYEIASQIGVTIKTDWKTVEWNAYQLIVDAIFGIGLTRDLSGDYIPVIEAVNHSKAKVIAVDIPSGIDAGTGKVKGTAIRADATVTFGYQKLGLVFYPGREYAGKVKVADIGFAKTSETACDLRSFYFTKKDLEKLPVRKKDGNKGTFGKVLVIAGTKNVSGAAYFSAKAAYRTGAGLVKIVTVSENRTILQTALPEALLQDYSLEDDTDKIKAVLLENLKWADTIVIGPGLGLHKTSELILQTVLNDAEVPVVVDADAIHLLKNQEQWQKKEFSVPVILTPHLKEMSALIGKSVDEIKNDLIETASCEAGQNENLIVVLKDAVTVVSDGAENYINLSGNNGMATGGSGDVLTGIIAALSAQGNKPFTAASLGVYIHGLSGDISSKEKGYYGVVADDLIDNIPKVLKKRRRA